MKATQKRRIVCLIGTFAAVVLIVVFSTDMLLYKVAVEIQTKRVCGALEVRTRLIEVNIIRRLGQTQRRDSQMLLAIENEVVEEMRQVNEESYRGLGQPLEFVWGLRQGSEIKFLLPLRHSKASSIPFNSYMGEPMKLALNGQSGTNIGLDYRGEKVLAAYAPINFLGRHYGLVSKVDLTELQAPFIRFGVIAFLLALVLIIAGAFFF
ncbi:MAG: hypothetical protein HQK97_10065 [Nitrospirae bacterium]|nr:hypothetical protein [Nitrospirota bacterium]